MAQTKFTVDDLVDQVNDRRAEDVQAFVKDAEIVNYFNEFLYTIDSDPRGGLWWTEKEKVGIVIPPDGIVNLDTLVPDWKDTIEVYAPNNSSMPAPTKFDFLTPREFRLWIGGNAFTIEGGDTNATLKFKTANGMNTGTVNMPYHRLLNTIVDTTLPMDLPSRYMYLPVSYALWRIYKKEQLGDEARDEFAIWNVRMDDMFNSVPMKVIRPLDAFRHYQEQSVFSQY